MSAPVELTIVQYTWMHLAACGALCSRTHETSKCFDSQTLNTQKEKCKRQILIMRIPFPALFISIILTSANSQDLCDPGWTRHERTCLRAFRFRLTQPAALSYCKRLGPSANLASVATKERFDVINSLVEDSETHTENFWIGLYIDNPSDSSDVYIRQLGWRWVDGTPYQVPDSTWGWNDWGEPGIGEQFVRMRSYRWLATGNDGEQNYFFCEKELPPTTTTTSTTTTESTTMTTTPTTTTTTTTSPTTTTTTPTTTTTTPSTTESTTTTTTESTTTTTTTQTTTESTTTPTTTTTLSSTLSTSDTTTPSPTTTTTAQAQSSSTASLESTKTSKSPHTTPSRPAGSSTSSNALSQSTTPSGSFNTTGIIDIEEEKPLKPEIVAIAVVVAVVLVLIVIIVIFACLRRSGSSDVMSSTLRSSKYAVSQPRSIEQHYIYDEADDHTFSNGSVKKQRNGSSKSITNGGNSNHASYVNNNIGDVNNRTSRSSKISDRFSWMMDRISTSALKEEFEKLNKAITTFGRRKNVYRKATMKENYTKNRSPVIIPLAPKRVVLKTEVPERNDYINAVFVDSYGKSNAFIATIAPLASTVSDFWRAVYDYECPLVIMLCPQHHLKLGEMYFPENTESESCVFDPFEATVSCNAYEKVGGLEMRDLALVYAHKAQRLRHFSVSCDLDTLNQREKINFFIQLYEQVKKWQLHINDTMSPMVVHCLDGVQWTGVLCTLFYTFDKVTAEGAQNVDVIEIIQEHRLSRPQFITSEDQLRLVLETVSVFAKSQGRDKNS